MDTKTLRVHALRRLIGHDPLKDFAERHDLDASYLSQILNGHRSMGEKAAAKMAQKIGVPEATLVSPPFAPDYDAMLDKVEEETGIGAYAKGGPELLAKVSSDAERRAEVFQSELLAALSILLMAASGKKITPKLAEPIFELRNKVVHGLLGDEPVTKLEYAEVPSSMRGLLNAAFKVAESGGNPDDLLSMIKHGNSKQRHKEAGEYEKPAKSRAESR